MAEDIKTQPADATKASPAPVAEAVSPKEDGRADYVVTERAGPRVAGRLVKAGDVVRLLMAEADYHLAAGEIVERPPAAAPGAAEAAVEVAAKSSPVAPEKGKRG